MPASRRQIETRIAAFAAAVAIAAASTPAHLEPGSLSSPAAGASYASGSPLRLTWVQAEYHFGNYALSWSRNTGETWEPIASWRGPSGNGVTVNYAWTVPDAPGAQARVRICQIGECGDPDYRLISGDFDIGPATGVRRFAEDIAVARLTAQGPTVEAAIGLDRAENVVLEIREASGRLRTTLWSGRFEAGSHRLVVEPRGQPRFGILRLRVGSRTVAWAPYQGP